MNTIIHTSQTVKKQHNFWNGLHFHPTDAIEDDWGKKILDTVAEDNVADMIRMYAMLDDIVTEDTQGNLQYDFTQNDIRLDYMISKGFRIFLSYNFMPACIAKDPSLVTKGRYKGKTICSSIPKDYSLWEEVCYAYTQHLVERYGKETVSSWYLQCWNEPDLGAFFMRGVPTSHNDPEALALRLREYCKLYKHFAAGVTKACDTAKIGGPSLDNDLLFLDGFLRTVHEQGIQIDFVGIHPYGKLSPVHAENNLRVHEANQNIIDRYFPEIEIIADEYGISGGGFSGILNNPRLAIRDGSEFAAYFGKMVHAYIHSDARLTKMLICLSGQHQTTQEFMGYRNMISLNYVKKPIYNAYLLLGKLKENILAVDTDTDNLTVLPTADNKGQLSVMLAYASEHFDTTLPSLSHALTFDGLHGLHTVRIWRIDDNHTNPLRFAEANGIGHTPSNEELILLRREGTIKPFAELNWDFSKNSTITVEMDNNALLLIEIA